MRAVLSVLIFKHVGSSIESCADSVSAVPISFISYFMVGSPLPLFDTHAHLDFPQFESDFDALVRRLETGTFPDGLAPEELAGQPINVVGVLVPGIDLGTRGVIPQARSNNLFHYAVGIHPNHTADITKTDWQTVAEQARQANIAAVGETGLDRHWNDAPFDVQIDIFCRHIELSQEIGKPILIHCREAWDDLLPILRRFGKLHGVIHAFSGNTEQMFECVELGLYISFSGSVTYRSAKFSPLWEAARQTPSARLLIETDAPFMVPHPYRGKIQCCEPTLAALTALRLSELRGDSLRSVAETTAENAVRMLSWR